ncbi:MAG: ferritin family protein [Pontiellaceae bacterium]|nr:ferritin family protein [Pontiellaceae bacterium]MBN2784718.1 ferritin family protein [Pontiellaceae bacterium]
MNEWKTADDILDFAISNEQKAVDFYQELAAAATKAWTRDVFEQYAREEMGHKAKIEAVKAGQKLKPVEGKVLDLKLGDYLVDIEPTPGMDYQSALVVAMKREKAAFRLYSDLARQVEEEDLKNLFLLLAQEEAKHKLRFEVEYDEYVLCEN